jgi:cysteine-rich repeat protein
LRPRRPTVAAAIAFAIIVSTAFLEGEARGQVCGDGTIDAGEDCDDSNTAAGDCCSPTCQNEPEGSACTIPLFVCPSGRCNSTGSCITAPRDDCRTALKSILLFKVNDDDTKDKLIWKWIKGEETAVEDFGVPTVSTNYEFCVYAGTSALVVDAQIPGGGPPPWSAIGTKGYKYFEPTGVPSGVNKVILKSGAAGKAKALLKGKGSNLPSGGMFPPGWTLPVTAQLVSSTNACFEATYETDDIIKNDGIQFRAKAQ